MTFQTSNMGCALLVQAVRQGGPCFLVSWGGVEVGTGSSQEEETPTIERIVLESSSSKKERENISGVRDAKERAPVRVGRGVGVASSARSAVCSRFGKDVAGHRKEEIRFARACHDCIVPGSWVASAMSRNVVQ